MSQPHQKADISHQEAADNIARYADAELAKALGIEGFYESHEQANAKLLHADPLARLIWRNLHELRLGTP